MTVTTTVSRSPVHSGPAMASTQQPIPDLVRQFAAEATSLARQEMELARNEMQDEASRAAGAGKVLGTAGAVGVVALAGLTTAAVFALARVMPGWAAGLIIGAIAAVIALVVGMAGRRRLGAVMHDAVPRRTLASLREELDWAKDHMHTGPRHHNGHPRSDQIAATRARMDDLVEAIAHQVDPKVRVQVAVDRSRETVKLAAFFASGIARLGTERLQGGST